VDITPENFRLGVERYRAIGKEAMFQAIEGTLPEGEAKDLYIDLLKKMIDVDNSWHEGGNPEVELSMARTLITAIIKGMQ
jgi:hypothetical protein